MIVYAFWEREVHHGEYTPVCLTPGSGSKAPTLYMSVEACRKAVDAFRAQYGAFYSNLDSVEWKGDELVCKGSSMDGIPYGEIMPLQVVE